MAKQKTAESKNGNQSITQADAVRQALASGVQTSKEGMAFIQKRFGLRMKPQAYYSYKSQLLKRKGKGVSANGKTSHAPAPAKTVDNTFLENVRAVKRMVDKYGIEKVREIVEVFK